MADTPDIQLYNSLTKRKEPLRTSDPDKVLMYVCGPTVYNFAHIGNARPAVIFDVLVTLLRHCYAQVTYARNITDIDDKINAASLESGEPIDVITQRFAQAYQEDMVRGLMKNFMLYATGRKPDIDDMAEIEGIMKKNASRGYPLRTMLLAVFQSEAFLEH